MMPDWLIFAIVAALVVLAFVMYELGGRDARRETPAPGPVNVTKMPDAPAGRVWRATTVHRPGNGRVLVDVWVTKPDAPEDYTRFTHHVAAEARVLTPAQHARAVADAFRARGFRVSVQRIGSHTVGHHFTVKEWS